ncbi:MAG: HK97 family phage prohead protease, partial [Lacipirellulaceae bacterium]
MKRVETRLAGAHIDSDGRFSGYASIFGNRDSHGDVINPGAFRETLKAWERRGRLPLMLLQHGSLANPFSGDDLPIGLWQSMQEDSSGLFVRGQLLAL